MGKIQLFGEGGIKKKENLWTSREKEKKTFQIEYLCSNSYQPTLVISYVNAEKWPAKRDLLLLSPL